MEVRVANVRKEFDRFPAEQIFDIDGTQLADADLARGELIQGRHRLDGGSEERMYWTQLVVSGEIPLALTVYNYKAEQLKNKGAPIDWRPLCCASITPFRRQCVYDAGHISAVRNPTA